tara:strand:- start:482 stop:1060 length:579 start_codon:yes stop_codon:yes gene_type:complete
MSTFRPTQNALQNQVLQFAIVAHANQVRKGNEHIPYVYHVIDVAEEVIYYSGLPIPELKIASIIALLHDTVEDTFVTIEDIRNQFGEEIAVGVAALSKDDSVVNSSELCKAAQLQESLDRLKKAPTYVQAVKLADRVSNLKNFPAMWSREKIEQYLNESMMIADQLGSASAGLHARLVSRIATARQMLSIKA